MGAEVTISGRISSAVTLVSTIRTTRAPTAHLFFPCLEYRAVSVMCGELGIEKGEDIYERGRRPSNAVAAAAILCTRLTAGVFSKDGCPQGQIGVDHVICHGSHNHVVSVMPEAIIYRESIPAGMCMFDA